MISIFDSCKIWIVFWLVSSIFIPSSAHLWPWPIPSSAVPQQDVVRLDKSAIMLVLASVTLGRTDFRSCWVNVECFFKVELYIYIHINIYIYIHINYIYIYIMYNDF